MRALALVAVVSVCALFAQEITRTTPPRIIHRVDLEYSKEGRKARLVGTVLLRVVVGIDGKARDFKVIRGLGLGLDENAIAAVRAWQFGPGMKDGQPVDVQSQIELNFSILDGDSRAVWHLARVAFHLPDGSERPVVEKAGAPHAAEGSQGATATVTFDIDEKGVPLNLQIDKTSDEAWGRDVTDALSNWRFKPASKDGTAISVSCTMDFVRGN
jgi:TonB family protein